MLTSVVTLPVIFYNLKFKIMKYKSKFSITANGIKVEENEIFDNNNQSGKLVFIPFTDTRFFEPVKTRKFVVEVEETDQKHFDWLNKGQSWTVTEITEEEVLPYWVIDFKKQYPESAKCFSSFPSRPDKLKEFYSRHFSEGPRISAIRSIKSQYDVGSKEAQDLVDFIWEKF